MLTKRQNMPAVSASGVACTNAFIEGYIRNVYDPNTKGKPTNSEFIALIADKLQLQLKSSEVANF